MMKTVFSPSATMSFFSSKFFSFLWEAKEKLASVPFFFFLLLFCARVRCLLSIFSFVSFCILCHKLPPLEFVGFREPRPLFTTLRVGAR